MTILVIIGSIITLALFILWGTALTNFLAFPRLQTTVKSNTNLEAKTQPLISILIPARNEATVIADSISIY